MISPKSAITQHEWAELVIALCGELSEDELILPEFALTGDSISDGDSVQAPVSRGTVACMKSNTSLKISLVVNAVSFFV